MCVSVVRLQSGQNTNITFEYTNVNARATVTYIGHIQTRFRCISCMCVSYRSMYWCGCGTAVILCIIIILYSVWPTKRTTQQQPATSSKHLFGDALSILNLNGERPSGGSCWRLISVRPCYDHLQFKRYNLHSAETAIETQCERAKGQESREQTRYYGQFNVIIFFFFRGSAFVIRFA